MPVLFPGEAPLRPYHFCGQIMWQPNRLEEERLEKARRLEAAGIELFPRRIARTHTTTAAIAAFEAAEQSANGSEIADILVTVTGRIRRANVKGKVSFKIGRASCRERRKRREAWV